MCCITRRFSKLLKFFTTMTESTGVDEDMQQEFEAVCREADSHSSFERISISSPISPSDDPSSCWTSDTFFPSLKTFPSHTCLGIWSLLFEGKSGLKNLDLNCCHIETDANSTHLEWSKMPKVWQRLQSLKLGRCTDLSMTMISEVMPQMGSLQNVTMPEAMLKDPQTTFKVTQDLSKRKISIKLISQSGTYLFVKSCPYQRI